MPAAVAPRARRGPLPPAKKTKLAQDHPQGLSALLHPTPDKKPTVAANSNGGKKLRNEKVDEASAEVAGGRAGGDVDMSDAPNQVIEISSAEEESNYASSDEEERDDAQSGAQEEDLGTAPVANGRGEDAQPREHGTAEPEELTFGERLEAQEPEATRTTQIVDVEKEFGEPNDTRALAAASNRPLAAPSASSLGTVLTQALRTNDQQLLDSCLRVIDVDTIYATVERLPSPLAGTLLQKLAERLSKRGRAAMTIVWVQWALAAHGGYLASQPQLVKQLAVLNKVLKERASGLQPLLSLKGRLDMLQAQLELRRRVQKRAANDDEEEAVIYVEGEDDYTSAEEEGEVENESTTAHVSRPKAMRKRAREQSQEEDDDDESSVDEMPTTMEVDEDLEQGSEDSDGLIDDIASETDNDTGDDMSEPMSDDLDDADDGSASEEDSKPARRSTVGRAGLARRY